MKKLLWVAAIAILLFSCQAKKPSAPAAQDSATPAVASKADVGYALGVIIGTNLKTTALDIDYNAFVKGMKDVAGKGTPKVTVEKASETVQAAMSVASEKKAKENLAAEAKFLAENGKKAGVTTTASGLQYEVLTKGTGPMPKLTDTVKVDYVGKLLDGSTFDSSIARGEPADIPLSQVIPGWSEGLQLMNVGSKYRLTIPSALAYGPQGANGAIPPNSTIVFEVTLISIEPPVKK
jgi:FKBP-type peptidyl-prolyl cis-trans isomerase FkpA